MNRIFHHWEKWECINMYLPMIGGVKSPEELRMAYAEFLRDSKRFTSALERVVKEWPISCEQFLTNDAINRVAWLGQAAMCIETGVPRKYRSGFMLLSEEEQATANAIAQNILNEWIEGHAQENRQLHL